MESQTTPIFEFDLGNYGDKITIASPEELRKWAQEEWSKWEWVNQAGQPVTSGIANQHTQFRDQLNNFASQWSNYRGSEHLPNILEALANQFQQFYCKRQILHSSSVEAEFLSKLKTEKGTTVAGGAYAALLNRVLPNGAYSAEFYAGMFEGFLFQREIDWTGAANTSIFNDLKRSYEAAMDEQVVKLKSLEAQNTKLNQDFQETLKTHADDLTKLENERTASLDKLQEEQAANFTAILSKHEDNLKTLLNTYDQKLALLKPVEYWNQKQKFHKRRSIQFGGVSLFGFLILTGSLGAAIYFMLRGLGQNENPKHWQIGILLVAVFFSIWVMRVLVRLFLSHLHLAEDAAERRTMIQTYLSIAREGTQFAPEDKALILQHLFRTASDGLVKDDAAPPAFLELFSRK
jgi:hypothetical protein